MATIKITSYFNGRVTVYDICVNGKRVMTAKNAAHAAAIVSRLN